MQEVIQIQNLKKTYPIPKTNRRLEVLKGISFSVKQGEIFGILGPNGAGKTTTLEIIEGLNKQDSGKAVVLNFDNLLEPENIKQNIGVQLQSADYLPSLTLGELLDLFASFYKNSALWDKFELLKIVGLEKKLEEQYKNLSGGQKQRFTIASSLVNKPKIIFLDEPTVGLDPQARRNLWSLIKDINQTGITVVLTTHFMDEAEFLCHRVAILDEGKILVIKEPKKLIEDLSHTTQISFFTEKPIAENLFQNFGITKILNHYPKMILEIPSLNLVSPIAKLLSDKQINFSGFTVKSASLEDVYLDITGKEYLEN